MSKICKQCGVEYSNSAPKCIVCGTEFDDVHIYQKRKKFILFGIIGVILIAACIAVVVVATGPKAAARRIMEAYKQNDVEEIIASYPEFLVMSEVLDMEEMLRNEERTAKMLSEYVLSYRLGEPKTPSDKEYKELMQTFRLFAGSDFDESEIEDIKQVLISYKGNLPVFWTSHAMQFTMVKYKNRWCFWPDFVWEISEYA